MEKIEKEVRSFIADTYYEFLGNCEMARDYNTGYILGITEYNDKIDDDMSDRLDNYNYSLYKKMSRRRIIAFMEFDMKEYKKQKRLKRKEKSEVIL